MTMINLITTFTLIIGVACVFVGGFAIGIRTENWLYIENGKASLIGLGGGSMIIATSFLPNAIDENFIYANIAFLAITMFMVYDSYKSERAKRK